jgi:hypothetical protein
MAIVTSIVRIPLSCNPRWRGTPACWRWDACVDLPLPKRRPISARGALLGLDLGTKTNGVATSDPRDALRPGWKQSEERISPAM